MSRRALLVEDDANIQRVLQLALREEGIEVTATAYGEKVTEILASRPVDIVLLDLMLPDIDGLEVCRQLRRHSDVPVLMVTARSDSQDIVAGLEAGADDYVIKPLVAKVLAARIRALLRRARPTGGAGAEVITAGELEIRPTEALVLRHGDPVTLTRTEFELLVEFARHLGQVISREDLLERVWGYGYFGDGRLVDVHLHRLRTKVEEDPARPQHLITVRGLGYKLQP